MIKFLLCIIIFSLISLICQSRRAPTEEQRVEEWYAKGNTWPPTWQPETNSMKYHLQTREYEIMTLAGADERWENWLQYIENRMVPKFTTHGFEVVDTPEPFKTRLFDAVRDPIQNFDGIAKEGTIDVIYHPPGMEAKFLSIGSLSRELHHGLKEKHEQWAGGMKLVPTSAYGIRFYQNGSSLAMHYDKVGTHVISSIVHVAHEYDDDKEPWPIQIEDHDGVLHSVNLLPGQMLFYESSKCLHGRMKTLKGRYYGSIFLHYRPSDMSIWNFTVDDIIANVPPHWNEGIMTDHGERWAGAALTVDSRASEIAPARTMSVNMNNMHREL